MMHLVRFKEVHIAEYWEGHYQKKTGNNYIEQY